MFHCCLCNPALISCLCSGSPWGCLGDIHLPWSSLAVPKPAMHLHPLEPWAGLMVSLKGLGSSVLTSFFAGTCPFVLLALPQRLAVSWASHMGILTLRVPRCFGIQVLPALLPPCTPLCLPAAQWQVPAPQPLLELDDDQGGPFVPRSMDGSGPFGSAAKLGGVNSAAMPGADLCPCSTGSAFGLGSRPREGKQAVPTGVSCRLCGVL